MAVNRLMPLLERFHDFPKQQHLFRCQLPMFYKHLISKCIIQTRTMAYQANDPSFSSHAIHLSSDFGNPTIRDIAPPICLSTTYKQDMPPGYQGFTYGRYGNPTRDCLQNCLAKLEDTKHCFVYSSGTAAAAMVIKLLRKGDHVVAQKDIYHGFFKLFNRLNAETDEIEVTFVDASVSENFKNIVRKNTRLVWLETPTNPLMKVIDLETVRFLVKSQNPSTIIACDNTFLTPYFQRPAKLGVDIIMHSCTKFLVGHSDVLMGALCTNDDDLYEKLQHDQKFYGSVPSPFDCYLVLRSLKTLELRMQRHMSNALELASFLDQHPMIGKVFHPGLESHPQHELSLKQCYGHSGIFSFYVKDQNIETTKKIVSRLRFIKLADSLGSTSTILKIPALMPANSLTEEEMKDQGITNGLLRISVGLENPQDIIQDMKQALDI